MTREEINKIRIERAKYKEFFELLKEKMTRKEITKITEAKDLLTIKSIMIDCLNDIYHRLRALELRFEPQPTLIDRIKNQVTNLIDKIKNKIRSFWTTCF